jgi:hypothetical protein
MLLNSPPQNNIIEEKQQRMIKQEKKEKVTKKRCPKCTENKYHLAKLSILSQLHRLNSAVYG